ncbi:Uncharacterised protein [Mycolicibacterium fortuitum]|uniref:Helix-turn-helix domain-containing protein n=1 Tax=Mycolicibacterium fortuitum TaxID=1766 RepID=A0A378WDC3_MYCFO|nr:Uncharacterised protein [Mycolicibacterium fortuitum]
MSAAWLESTGGHVELHLAAGPPVATLSGAEPITTVAAIVETLARVDRVVLWDADTHVAKVILEKAATDELWTADQCAQHLGIATRTWYAYVNRPSKRNPAPQSRRIGGTLYWEPAAVRTYGAQRRPRRKDPGRR